MPNVTFWIYKTTIVNGVATGASEHIQITVNDADGNGAINRDEWISHVANNTGHTGGVSGGVDSHGNPILPALWEGDGTGNFTSGVLYTEDSIAKNTHVNAILDSLKHNKYSVKIDDIRAICFLAGTLIATPEGERPVESLRRGDLVLTKDHGPQPLLWTDYSLFDGVLLDVAPNQRAIRIEAGALGDGLPRRATEVSAQHRVLVTDEDGAEYLIPAIHLIKAGVPGVSVRQDVEGLGLYHIACAQHEIIFAEGAPMESFFTGPMALRALSPAARLGLMAAYPELADGRNPMTPARPFIKHRDYARMRKVGAAV